jgi:hypothetical protein
VVLEVGADAWDTTTTTSSLFFLYVFQCLLKPAEKMDAEEKTEIEILQRDDTLAVCSNQSRQRRERSGGEVGDASA